MITALALFTVVPVRGRRELTRRAATVALRWLPLVGALLGALAGLPLAAARAEAPHATWLGAVLSIVALALLTRGLHLDGLADTADGLGSRAPAQRALEIMRRSDIGPFGVLALVLVLATDVAALGSIGGTWRPSAALALAAATGRVAALHAAHPRVPGARQDGFGAHVAGSAGTVTAAVATAGVLGLAVGLAAACDADLIAWPVAVGAALLIAAGFRWHTTRRLGGVTGDVFGALVELGTALALVGLAFA